CFFFFSSRRRHTRWPRDWSSDVCSSDLSIIYGAGDELVSMLARLVRRAPVVPVLGSGETRLQPIAVEHVAEGFVRALRAPVSVRSEERRVGKEWRCGGAREAVGDKDGV